MLSTALTMALIRAERTLRTLASDPKDKAALALCAEHADTLREHIDAASASYAKAERSRAARVPGLPKQRGGRPPSGFVVDMEPGSDMVAWGARAACDEVERIAKAAGARWTVGVQSLHNAISRDGHWWRVLETDAGTVTVTVRRASPEREEAETAKVARSLQ